MFCLCTLLCFLNKNYDADTNWCTYCKTLGPEFAKAAKYFVSKKSKNILGKVDTSAQSSLAQKFGVRGIPVVKFFKKGSFVCNYDGERTATAIINWLESKTKPSLKTITTVKDAKKVIEENEVLAFGFFTKLTGKEANIFTQVASDYDGCAFAITSEKKVFAEYKVANGDVVVFKQSDDERVNFEGHLVAEELQKFLKTETVPILIEFNKKNENYIFKGPFKNQVLIFMLEGSAKSSGIEEAARVVAKLYKEVVLFVTVKINDPNSKGISDYFFINFADTPAIRMINLKASPLKYKPTTNDLSSEGIKAFVELVMNGNIKPYFKSENLPDDWDKNNVYKLVGSNFDSVINDETKDVLVDFYTPWCGYCKQMEPMYEQLGKRFKGDDVVMISKIDLEANEVSYPVKSFPTIVLFRKTDNKPVVYSGDRTLEALSKFVSNGGS